MKESGKLGYNKAAMSETPAPTKEPLPLHKPEFDGETFTIEYLSTSPNGFEVATRESHTRRDRITPTTRDPIPLHQDQREQLKIAMVDQMRFAEGDKAKTSLDNLRKAKTDQEIINITEDYQNKRKTYKERSVPTIGLRNIKLNNNIVTVDIKPVDFPTYREFSKPEASLELLNFASASATSIILITRNNRLILQHRSTRNKMYGGVPGASVAGYLRGNFDSTEKGKFVPIDTDYVKNDSAREANEELGLDREDFMTLKIVGIVHERVQVHDEFMLLGQTNLTAEEMKEKAMRTSRNRRLSEQEFDEKFVDIPADPDSITTLLTKVKCPIPPSHIAAFVSAGYYMMLEQFGMQKAMEWKNMLQDEVRTSYLEIDRMVEEYYLQNPNALNVIPERHKNSNPRKRNPKGYDSEYLPEEQGLPDIMSEFKRVGLIS